MVGSAYTLVRGDALASLRLMPSESVDCVVTSPPYWGLRDYGVAGQMGLEATPAEYVAGMVAVFAEVRRVLKDDGTLWLNLGDSYCTTAPGTRMAGNQETSTLLRNGRLDAQDLERAKNTRPATPEGLKPKDMVGIPWRVAFALQADGWWLRSDVIWSKTTVMPESVTDRPTKAHEDLFLFAKNATYHYDADAIREDDAGQDHPRSVLTGQASLEPTGGLMSPHRGLRTTQGRDGLGRNKRSVWTIGPEPYVGAHFAVMPTALVKPCVLAGCRVGGTVLDPFAGSGTVGIVAIEHGCRFYGIELNPAYVALASKRLDAVAAQGRLALGGTPNG